MIVTLIEKVYSFLWGDLVQIPLPGGSTLGISLLIILLIPTGIYFTVRTRFLPIRLFPDMVQALVEKKQEKNSLSSFQTLIVSTATRVGMGNLVGVVAAISAGGAGEKQPDNAEGWFETVCNRTGEFFLDGYLELEQGNGEVLRREFSQKYTVVEPTATVSATMMNVLYAGYDNPISISVPGVLGGQVQASIVNGNGTLNRAGNGYIAHPTTIGKDVVIRVTASVGGRTQSMGDYTYRVRQLPDPSPFIEYTEDGTPKRYRGGRGLSKAILMNTPGIVAAIDDGLLNINFRVLGFETVFFDNMGNAVPEVSSGASFSTRQKDMFRRLSRGKRFYISRVRAVGPDGVERLLPTTLEVIVN